MSKGPVYGSLSNFLMVASLTTNEVGEPVHDSGPGPSHRRRRDSLMDSKNVDQEDDGSTGLRAETSTTARWGHASGAERVNEGVGGPGLTRSNNLTSRLETSLLVLVAFLFRLRNRRKHSRRCNLQVSGYRTLSTIETLSTENFKTHRTLLSSVINLRRIWKSILSLSLATGLLATGAFLLSPGHGLSKGHWREFNLGVRGLRGNSEH